ncbi:alpha/beta hydrolase [Flavobacterium alkalisoli]|uniref:Alpha/beta hydrolase n=1 Tax=Flavobacterium alkalisoli TaxID=2602769 RepID=A0A5B9FXW6_9FLAO|nr:alpha/beta hydrolase [Flavobacterium alkalisoli]QEE50816.1 alpha/beta hydrolase [Flavobacterium alkalisoli]
METPKSKTVLFVTGAFVTHRGWDKWKEYFEANGYTTLAPPWPHKDAPAKVLRKRHPDPGIASVRLEDVVDHYAEIIAGLPEEPIIIGHSFGGLVTQLLLQRGFGVAAVVIHSVPPQGVLTFKWSFFKAVWGPLGLFTSTKKTFLMSFPQWQYAFTNGMSLEEQQQSYDENVIPESKLASRDGLTSAAKINFKKPHPPLLFIAGTNDNIMPASLNYSNYKKYKDKSSVTNFKEFSENNHYVVGMPNWKETAGYALNWIKSL